MNFDHLRFDYLVYLILLCVCDHVEFLLYDEKNKKMINCQLIHYQAFDI